MVTSLSLLAVWKVLKRAGCRFAVLVPMLVSLSAPPSFANSIVYTGTSVVFSGTAVNGLSGRATFTVDPGNLDVLRVLLENTSGPTMAPSHLLTSFYFNVLSGTITGTPAPLTYQNATGFVYQATLGGSDRAVRYVPPMTSGTAVTYIDPPVLSNLQAFGSRDDTWMFRSGLGLVASSPPLAFGVGTVGNGALTPNNFFGSLVGTRNFGIYRGDIETSNLNNELLVRDSANFEFAGFRNFNLAQVSPHAVFGFGTNPETIISVPEPATLSLAAFGLLAALLAPRWRRDGGPPASVRHPKAAEISGN
ncbi:MAG: XDD4 family exosortase-dependent surface protein [Planctomycetia bacterium]